ncbi:MAG: hypothetical protein ACRCU0_05265 [Candidatus Rhabdochlamydia sp.]
MEEVLRTDRTRRLFKGTLKDKPDEDEKNIKLSQCYINKKNPPFSKSYEKQKKTKTVIPNSEHRSLSSRSIKVAPNIKSPSSIRCALLYWLCMQ